MSNRREFMGQIVSGTTGLVVSGLVSSQRILGANDRVRFGLIGAGSRGKEIFKARLLPLHQFGAYHQEAAHQRIVNGKNHPAYCGQTA